jgi:hypothetical protein
MLHRWWLTSVTSQPGNGQGCLLLMKVPPLSGVEYTNPSPYEINVRVTSGSRGSDRKNNKYFSWKYVGLSESENIECWVGTVYRPASLQTRSRDNASRPALKCSLGFTPDLTLTPFALKSQRNCSLRACAVLCLDKSVWHSGQRWDNTQGTARLCVQWHVHYAARHVRVFI